MTMQLSSAPTFAARNDAQRAPHWHPHSALAASWPHSNDVLAAVAASESHRCLDQLEYVAMPLNQMLCDAEGQMSHVYFPTTAIVSLMYVCRNGASAASAITGCEGMVGISHLVGGGNRASKASVLCAGQGYRLRSHILRSDIEHGGALLQMVMRHALALITQIALTATCNRYHTLDQQLPRALLMCLDRVHGPELALTQEAIANALGVRREGVTAAALKLQTAGIIRYARGRITVLDRAELERQACECYPVVKAEYASLRSALTAA